MRITSYILILSLVISIKINAQIDSKSLSKKFSPSLVINLYNDVLTKIDVNENLQFQLANLYAKRDSLIFSKLSTNTPKTIIARYADSLLYDIEIKFKKLLPTDKKREYFEKVERARQVNFPIIQDTIYMDVEMNSQFGLALALYEKFRLKQNQKDSLIYYASLLKVKESYAKEKPDSGYFDKAFFESENMPKILTDEEYNGLLSIKNKTVAESYSKHTWYQLKKDGLLYSDSKASRDSILSQLKLFYLSKATVWDKFACKPLYRNIIIQQIPIPPVLQKALLKRNNTDAKLEKYNW
jgi:hypothetical protein